MSEAWEAAVAAALDAWVDDQGWLQETSEQAQKYMRAEMDRTLRAFLSEAEARGWRMVPVEPDASMISDGHYAAINARRGGVCGMTIDAQVKAQGAREVAAWAAMLAAAPHIEGE